MALGQSAVTQNGRDGIFLETLKPGKFLVLVFYCSILASCSIQLIVGFKNKYSKCEISFLEELAF